MPDMHQTIHDFISIQVTGGYANRQDIIEAATADFRDQYDAPTISRVAARIVDSLLAQHIQAQKAWTHETDCDKLDEAFATLDRNGIIARQNFTCCQTCGHREIEREMDLALERRPVQGYVFFHELDTELVVTLGRLYLCYGALDGRENSAIEIGHEIVATLEHAGLQVAWNGSITKRIGIHNLNWQRRRWQF